jgi:hypothetical protein
MLNETIENQRRAATGHGGSLESQSPTPNTDRLSPRAAFSGLNQRNTPIQQIKNAFTAQTFIEKTPPVATTAFSGFFPNSTPHILLDKSSTG